MHQYSRESPAPLSCQSKDFRFPSQLGRGDSPERETAIEQILCGQTTPLWAKQPIRSRPRNAWPPALLKFNPRWLCCLHRGSGFPRRIKIDLISLDRSFCCIWESEVILEAKVADTRFWISLDMDFNEPARNCLVSTKTTQRHGRPTIRHNWRLFGCRGVSIFIVGGIKKSHDTSRQM